MTGRHNHTRWLSKTRRALPLALAVALLIALFGCDGEAALDTAVPTRTTQTPDAARAYVHAAASHIYPHPYAYILAVANRAGADPGPG